MTTKFIFSKYLKSQGRTFHISFRYFTSQDTTWGEFNRGNSKKFVDRARIRVAAGRGGNGCISFEMFSDSWRRPSGGHGGPGGDVILVADSKIQSLSLGVHHFRASHGSNGGSKDLRGRKGKNMIIRVPCGTVVKKIIRKGGHIHEDEYVDFEEEPGAILGHVDESEYGSSMNPHDGQMYEEEDEDNDIYDASDEARIENKDLDYKTTQDLIQDKESDDEDYDLYDDDNLLDYEEEEDEFDEVVVADLIKTGDTFLAAVGGRPGLGNGMLASSKAKSSTLHHRSSGHFGEEAFLNLELKLIAQIGLVGYPNAGKSSFLGAVSNVQPHIAPYPFTTMKPGLGIIEYSDLETISVADLPGLVDGAHENRGLGHNFLRHVERVEGLVFMVDAAGVDGRSPVEDLTQLMLELELYDPSLIVKPSIVVANKVDLPEAQAHLPDLRRAVKNLEDDSKELSETMVGGEQEGAVVGVQGMYEMSLASGRGLSEVVLALRRRIVSTK